MQTRVDRRLLAESEETKLRFSCAHCAHFELGSRRCSGGFPNEEHDVPSLEGRSTIVFCKAFELG